MPPPRIAVLINNYNNAPWLRACVDSVLVQTRPPEEIIVYDDGSTDESLPLLRSYGDRLRVLAGVHVQARTGLDNQAQAVAAAFRASAGDHIYLLDGDDAFLPEKIARYEAAWAARPDAVLVQAPTRLVDGDGHTQRDGFEALKHPSDGDYLAATYRTQDTDLYYSTSALAFSRSFLDTQFPLDFSDDIALAVDSRLGSVAPLHGAVIGLPETLTLWRQHNRSQSRQGGQRTPLDGTLRRHRFFNAYARRHGHRPLRLLLNPRFHRQLARRLLPSWVSAPFAHNPAGQRPPT